MGQRSVNRTLANLSFPALLVGVLLLGAACGTAQEPCSPSNCTGCCAGDVCQPGSLDTACGVSGLSCSDCSASNQMCLAGSCVSVGIGGPGGKDGGAPGTGKDGGEQHNPDGGTGCTDGEVRCGESCVGTDADPMHCGACDAACGQGEVCVSGACQMAPDCRNTPCVGLSYCDMTNGMCIPGCSEDAQCGENERCDLTTHACVCESGTHDCEGVCVSNSSPASCGPSSCTPCSAPANAYATCADPFQGTCGYMCQPGFNLCGQQCVPESVSSCGSSCTPCPSVPNSTPVCQSGQCLFACAAGFANCNGIASDGCEVELSANPNHCGACGVTCSTSNWPQVGSYECSQSQCGIDTCNTGYADCDLNKTNGCEKNLNTNPSACSTATSLGTVSGDVGMTSTTAFSGSGEAVLSFNSTEDSNFPNPLSFTVTLTNPPGVQYDLFVRKGSCTATAQPGTGTNSRTYQVCWCDTWGIDDDSLQIAEVRHKSGAACGTWSVTVTGNSASQLCSCSN